jgi:hypothetical protein
MSSRGKVIAVAGACTVAGAVAGIAGAAAAPASRPGAATTRHAAAGLPPRPGFPGGFRMADGPAVHEDAVVLNRAGTHFITATSDNGTVVSVSGGQLQMNEAIGKVSYKTVTLTIPAGATVVRNMKSAKLSDLKAGDHVHVTQSSDGTSVIAGDGAFAPPGGRPRRPGGPGHFGPGGPHGGWAPPPGPPGPKTTTTTTTTTS